MEREELLKALRRQEVIDNLRCLGCGHEHHCSTKGCAINRAAAERIEQLTAENEVLRHPPNPPLTLEELREMDGEPVWVQAAKASGKIPARWMLLECSHKDRALYLFTPASGITQGYKGENYGKTWLAYRRKPEGGI